MKFKLKDMNTGDKFLMVSPHGNGLCLFQVVQENQTFPHGVDCLNLFTEELEFSCYKQSDGEFKLVYYIDNSTDVESLLNLYENGAL